jgi:hypothetical protein
MDFLPVMEDASRNRVHIRLVPNLLRRAGLPVSLEQTMAFAEALTLVDIGSRSQVYYAARGCADPYLLSALPDALPKSHPGVIFGRCLFPAAPPSPTLL